MGVYLSQNQGVIIGPISRLLGLIMNTIYNALAAIGIENIGLAIILFTLIVNLLMMPLTIRQQRFSKLQSRMNPELKAIQDKYKNRRDNAAMLAQQEEMRELYAKYGVSQLGTCMPLFIQLPILWALYRVIYAIPAYVTKVREVFLPLAKSLLGVPESFDFMKGLSGAAQYASQFSNEAFTMSADNTYAVNTYIDVLNRSSTADWAQLAAEYPALQVNETFEQVRSMNNFLGLNIGNSPSFMIKEAWASGAFLLVFAALLIPVLAAVLQWVNTKLMPQAAQQGNANDQQAQMMNSMRTMNTVMPIFSAFICFGLPIGAGLYWVAGSVIRIAQQVFINKRIDKMDIEAMIARNEEKYREKMEKRGEKTKDMSRYASMNTRNMATSAAFIGSTAFSQEEKDAAVQKARDYYDSGKARKGSLLEAANLVRAYDEKNNRS